MGMPPASIAAAAVCERALRLAWKTLHSNLIKRRQCAHRNFEHTQRLSHVFRRSRAKFMYGFSGLRIQEKGLVGAYAPVLPPEWKSMTLKKGFVPRTTLRHHHRSRCDAVK